MLEYCVGEGNSNGEYLKNFAQSNNLKIANTFFKKRKNKKWTWQSPDSKTKNEIDHVLINDIRIVVDTECISSLSFLSDHRIVKIKLKISRRNRYKNLSKSNKSTDFITPEHKKPEIKEKFKKIIKEFESNFKGDLQGKYNKLENTLKEIIESYSRFGQVTKTDEKLTTETKELITKRNKLARKSNKNSRDKIELSELSKLTKKKIRTDILNFIKNKISEIIESTWSTKKAKKTINNNKNLIIKIQNEEGELEYSRTGLVQLATNFYRDLYDRKEENSELTLNLKNIVNVESFPPILNSEIETILKNLKKNKVPGPDKINNEILSLLWSELTPVLSVIFNEIIEKETIPIQWKISEIILLYKKGDKSNINNYRPISLISNLCKVFTKIIKNRIYPQLDSMQSKEQAGFRKDYSTIDQIFIINQIIEKANEYNLNLNLLLIDFNKAFDSVNHDYLWNALYRQCLKNKEIKIIRELYREGEAYIKLDREGSKFKIKKGVKQGDPLSPNLFNCILEEIFGG